MCSKNIFLPLVSGLDCPRIRVLIFLCVSCFVSRECGGGLEVLGGEGGGGGVGR